MVRMLRAERQAFWEQVRSGKWAWQAAEAAGVYGGRGQALFAQSGGVMEPRRRPSSRFLSHAEREEIAILHAQRLGVREIGRRVGRPHTTVSREIARNGNRDGSYRALTAQQRAEQRARRPKAGKLATNPVLRAYVEDKLTRLQWSPEQICEHLVQDYPDDGSMRCCPETIYRSIYVQGRGELRRELAAHLRTGRDQRTPHHRPERRKGRLVDTIHISQRPAEAKDRAVPGHWEGDLILGKAGGSAIGTLVERTTRYLMLVHLPKRRTAEDFAEALVPVLHTLPDQLRKSLTWDQGKEMALHKQIAFEADIELFFCDPRSPWQRGSNENTNGLLRQYFPKTLSLRQFTPTDLAEVAWKLNTRPRKTLGWATPAQRLEELLCGHQINRGATTG
ncbi:IS30 family transposase [Nocardioides lacusdianchii]|uniref:IS30 family transposase n=1 Tax=Nocardioides lacusdianchii TaxID=2783664 RepID=UPI003FD8B1B3